MDKILVAKGENFDSNLLISSLKRMAIDSKESVKVIQGHNMEYIDDGIKKESFFIGQVVNENNKMPGIMTIEDRDLWVVGTVDEKSVLNSKILEDYLNEENRLKVYENPSLLLKYLIPYGDKTIERLFIDYRINSIYSILDTSLDKTSLHFRATYNAIGYIGKKDGVTYFSNSKEIMEYLGIDYKVYRRLESISKFYPGLSIFSGICLSSIENEALKQIKVST